MLRRWRAEAQEGYIAVDEQRVRFPHLHGAWGKKVLAEAYDRSMQNEGQR